jgi:hypothetical protein
MWASRRTGTGAAKAFRFGVAAVEFEGGSCTSAVDAGEGADADAGVGVGVEVDSGGRIIGARRSVETETKPEERGFGLDSITGDGIVGEEAAVEVAEVVAAAAAIVAASRSGSGGEDDETSSGSGPGSYASNLPNHSATRPFVADLRRTASSSSSSRLPSLFFFLFAFPSLLLLLTRSLSLSLSFSFESDLADLRDRALYVPRSLLDEAPLP